MLTCFRTKRGAYSSQQIGDVHFTHVLERQLRLGAAPCGLPDLQVLVLTATRPSSLSRLLQSLGEAEYGCARVDLQINIDEPKLVDTKKSHACADVAAAFSWQQGRKQIFRRLSHAGLSQSWFEAPYASNHEYILILEDDMEVSKHFFRFFAMLQKEGSLSGASTSALCLHPNDWEVRVPESCGGHRSPYLYLSPEPCNWGPIWKYSEWRKFIDWVKAAKAKGIAPFVPESLAYNFNKYLRQGKDVQSPWVWRYNFEYRMSQMRYSFVRCAGHGSFEAYFAINHKEPGEHFTQKLDIDNDPSLLVLDYDSVVALFYKTEKSFYPATFPGYESGEKSLGG